MKATGIVRRIDDLGRVVIPKEIRRTMRIREGDPLEIYTDAGGLVVFKKYSPMGELSGFAAQYAQALMSGTFLGIAVADKDAFLAAAGLPKKERIGMDIPQALSAALEERKTLVLSAQESEQGGFVFAGRNMLVVCPIISSGDLTGCVVLFSSEKASSASDSDIKLAKVAAEFLGRQNEE